MAITVLYAGNSSNLTNSDKLPSPDSLKVTYEQIWDSEAGRNASGEMIATYKASKRTYTINWGILSGSQFQDVRDKLTTSFFYFGVGSKSGSTYTPPSTASEYYRSEISCDEIIAGGATYYKDVAVQVIQK